MGQDTSCYCTYKWEMKEILELLQCRKQTLVGALFLFLVHNLSWMIWFKIQSRVLKASIEFNGPPEKKNNWNPPGVHDSKFHFTGFWATQCVNSVLVSPAKWQSPGSKHVACCAEEGSGRRPCSNETGPPAHYHPERSMFSAAMRNAGRISLSIPVRCSPWLTHSTPAQFLCGHSLANAPSLCIRQ